MQARLQRGAARNPDPHGSPRPPPPGPWARAPTAPGARVVPGRRDSAVRPARSGRSRRRESQGPALVLGLQRPRARHPLPGSPAAAPHLRAPGGGGGGPRRVHPGPADCGAAWLLTARRGSPDSTSARRLLQPCGSASAPPGRRLPRGRKAAIPAPASPHGVLVTSGQRGAAPDSAAGAALT